MRVWFHGYAEHVYADGTLQEAIKKSELWRLNDGKGKPPGLLGW
jgi:hypothetical protein